MNTRKLTEILDVCISIYEKDIIEREVQNLKPSAFFTPEYYKEYRTIYPAMCNVAALATLQQLISWEERQKILSWIHDKLNNKKARERYLYLADMLKAKKKGWQPRNRLAWYKNQQAILQRKGL